MITLCTKTTPLLSANSTRTARRIKNRFATLCVACVLSMVISLQGATPSTAQQLGAGISPMPATPQEFAEGYGAASASLSSEAVASFYSNEVTSIPYKGESYVMTGKAEQRERLAGFFTSLDSRGITALVLSDYTITQISDHFAFARLRWDLSQADGTVANTVNSTYVLRLENAGWRAVTILEMGKPHGP